MSVTTRDAYHREKVRVLHRGWTGTLLYVDEARERAKVILPSGDVILVPLDQLIRADAPQAMSTLGGPGAAGHQARHGPQAV